MYNRRYMQDEQVPATTEELYAYMEANTGRGRYGFVEQHSTAYYSAPGYTVSAAASSPRTARPSRNPRP